MTLLDLVNSLRFRLRSGDAKTGIGSDLESQVEVSLVNDAARDVLGTYAWSFLHRHTGNAFFPPRVVVTSLQATFGSLSMTMTSVSANDLSRFSGFDWQSKVVVGDQTYRIADLDTGTGVATLESPYRGTTSFANDTPFLGSEMTTGTLWANEVALPETVRNVLSVRREDQTPVRFTTIQRIEEFDARYPDVFERFDDHPIDVAVGGYVESTARGSGDRTRGTALTIYPAPGDLGVTLHYSFIHRHPTLSAATDALHGVPEEVQDHIVWVAVQHAMGSNIQDSPTQARRLLERNEIRLSRLKASDRKDSRRHAVLRPFGRSSDPRFHVEHRSVPEA